MQEEDFVKRGWGALLIYLKCVRWHMLFGVIAALLIIIDMGKTPPLNIIAAVAILDAAVFFGAQWFLSVSIASLVVGFGSYIANMVMLATKIDIYEFTWKIRSGMNLLYKEPMYTNLPSEEICGGFDLLFSEEYINGISINHKKSILGLVLGKFQNEICWT